MPVRRRAITQESGPASQGSGWHFGAPSVAMADCPAAVISWVSVASPWC
jgi:hypothetical protein